MNDTTSTLPTNLQQPPTHENISQKAKELWENYGRPAGRDEEIWLEAERLLHAPATPVTPSSPAPVAPRATPPAASPSTASAAPRGSATATPRSGGGRTRSAAR